MHIGIDARIYGTFHRGIGRYTEELIRCLGKIQNDNRYTLFMRSEDARKCDFDKAKFKIVIADVPHYSIKEHIAMPRIIRKSRVDIMHFTHLNVPFWCPVPYVVTIHDLIIYHFPTSRATNLPLWKYKIKLIGYRAVLKNAVKKAKKIIAVSEFTKRDIVRNLGADETKIEVVYLGSDKMLKGTEKMRNTEQFSRFLEEKYGISKQYILYVGSAYPHKNLINLIGAHKLLKEKYQRNWQLVLVGREDEFYKKIKSYADDKDIIFTGDVLQRELDGLYRGAKVFVMPSLYEGFGLPLLEAATRYVPVACSKTASLPEVMSDSALYFDPKNIESMANVIDKIGGSHLIQGELATKGFERAKLFSWEKAAQKTVDVYSSIMV